MNPQRSKSPEIAAKAGYTVSSDGRVFAPSGKQLKLSERADGRLYFSVGRICKCKVHLLQAWQKFGPAMHEEGIEVRHLDGNCQNNSDENITIGTKSQNMMDKPAWLRMRMSSLANLKYDRAQVIAFYDTCRSYRLTKERFSIPSSGTVHNILHRPSIPQQAA